MDRKRQKLNPEKIEESSDDALGINALPNEMILKIFGYLEQNQLGQIARVCSRWNMLTRSPALWKKVDVKFHCSQKSHNTMMTRCFVNMLPSCVTSIRLDYSNLNWTEKLDFEEFCVSLQRKCPRLEMLILEHVHSSDFFSSVVRFCNRFLPDIKILVFRHCTFSLSSLRGNFDGISKIEVLDVSECSVRRYHQIQFSNMPQLRVLKLNSRIDCKSLLSFKNHGLYLEELYLCQVFLYPEDAIFSSSMFPHLKILCLCSHCIEFVTVVSALQSCQSLQKVYFHELYLLLDLKSHPFFKDHRCKLKIIEGIAEDHSHNIDYTYKTNKI